LFRVALALFKIHGINLLNCKNEESLMQTLKQLHEKTKSEVLMEVAYSIKLKKSFLCDELRKIRVSHMPVIPEEYLSEGIMDTIQFHDVLSFLPEQYRQCIPKRLFYSNVDGFNLTVVIEKCHEIQPTILVLKSDTGRIFGAFITVPWDIASSTTHLKGTGEMFLFTLHPSPRKFKWTRADNLFMTLEPKKLAFGINGLVIDDELNNSYSERSKTFNNDPVGDEKEFKCVAAEVYSFQMI